MMIPRSFISYPMLRCSVTPICSDRKGGSVCATAFPLSPNSFTSVLEENPDPELQVARQRVRRVAGECSKIRVIRLPNPIEFETIQCPDVERQWVSRGKTLGQLDMEEI